MNDRLIKQLQEIKLDEAFNNWTYTPSTDPQTLVYDFYLLNALPEPKDENLKVALRDSRNVLYNFLKNEILHTVKYVIAQEFLHIFVLNREEDVTQFLASYHVNYKHTEDAWELATEESENFVKAAETAFKKFKWYEKFGGEQWSKICRAWLELYNQTDKSLGVLAADIDHIYNIEHHTGLLFSKLKTHGFLYDVLNFKRDSKSEYNFFEHVSSDLKLFAAAVLKDALGTDYEGWLKGDKSQRFFPRQNEKVQIVNSYYVYNSLPSFVNNMSESITNKYSISEARVLNNFKYLPLLSMQRLYLVETVVGEKLLVDERGLSGR